MLGYCLMNSPSEAHAAAAAETWLVFAHRRTVWDAGTLARSLALLAAIPRREGGGGARCTREEAYTSSGPVDDRGHYMSWRARIAIGASRLGRSVCRGCADKWEVALAGASSAVHSVESNVPLGCVAACAGIIAEAHDLQYVVWGDAVSGLLALVLERLGQGGVVEEEATVFVQVCLSVGSAKL